MISSLHAKSSWVPKELVPNGVRHDPVLDWFAAARRTLCASDSVELGALRRVRPNVRGCVGQSPPGVTSTGFVGQTGGPGTTDPTRVRFANYPSPL